MKLQYVSLGSCLFLGLWGAVAGCTNAASVCAMICECQHCNKYAEIDECHNWERSEAQADAYGCGEQFSALISCITEKWTCDEEKVQLTTRAPGKCLEQQLGQSCMTDGDCFGNNSCSNGSCVERVCDGFGYGCSVDADCLDKGPDLCESEENNLHDCIHALRNWTDL